MNDGFYYVIRGLILFLGVFFISFIFGWVKFWEWGWLGVMFFIEIKENVCSYIFGELVWGYKNLVKGIKMEVVIL